MDSPAKIKEISEKLYKKLSNNYHDDIKTRFDYDYRTGKIHVCLYTSAGYLYDQYLEATKQYDLDTWTDTIIGKITEFKNARNKLLKDAAEFINNIPRKEDKFQFEKHELGACSYASLGHMRYTWLCLSSPRVHNQWCKLYVDSDYKFNKEHTTKTMTTLRASPYESINNKIPPKVAIVLPQAEDAVYEYISKNPSLLEMAYKLPLNKTKMREDTEYIIALLKEENGKLYPLEQGEILNPTLSLWMAVMLRYSPYGRKLDGWAKKIDGDEIKEITRINTRASTNYDKGTIFMNKALYHSWYGYQTDLHSYSIGNIVSEKDEYINYLLDTAILEYLKKIK